MISRFRHKGLDRFFKASDHRGIPAQHIARMERMLDRLDSAVRAQHPEKLGAAIRPIKAAA